MGISQALVRNGGLEKMLEATVYLIASAYIMVTKP